MNGRGQYGRRAPSYGYGYGWNTRPSYGASYGASPYAVVGIHWTLHPIADRTQVVDQLTTEINTLYNELVREMGADPSALDPMIAIKDPQRLLQASTTIQKSPLYPVYRDVLSPFLKEWNAFHRGYSEWSEALWLTSWDKLVDFKNRWHAIYDKVVSAIGSHGGKILAPPPQEIPKDVVDNIEDSLKAAAGKVGEKAGEAWNLVKYGLYAAIGIGAVIALSSVASNVRSGRDPAEKYVDLIRNRRRATQLALPAGEG